jgi:hypothetical protein
MPDLPTIPDGYVRVSEALRASGLPYRPDHICRLVRAGKIPGCRVGGLWFVSPRDLAQMIKVGAPS